MAAASTVSPPVTRRSDRATLPLTRTQLRESALAPRQAGSLEGGGGSKAAENM
jgi:hypothetical protein